MLYVKKACYFAINGAPVLWSPNDRTQMDRPIYFAVDIRPFLCLTEHHAMKTCRGVDIQLHALLTSTLNGRE